MNTIGPIIKKTREGLGLTQYNVATDIGISQSAYAQLEFGATMISVERAIEIAALLNIDFNIFIQKTSPKSSSLKSSEKTTAEYQKLVSLELKFEKIQNDISYLIEEMDKLTIRLNNR